jgi:hypothetical protein
MAAVELAMTTVDVERIPAFENDKSGLFHVEWSGKYVEGSFCRRSLLMVN